MTSRIVFTVLLMISVGLSAATAQTKINASVSDFSSQFTGRPAVNTVNGSGLNTATNPPTHDTVATDMWLNTGDGFYGGGVDPDYPTQLGHITFDLGSNMLFQSFRVWNYNEVYGGISYTTRGVQTLTISYALSAAPTTFLPLIDPSTNNNTWTFDQAPGSSTYTGQLFTLAVPQLAEFIRFDIKTNYGDPHRFVGLSEVQFYTPAPVPEPSSIGLFGVGLVLSCLAIRRASLTG